MFHPEGYGGIFRKDLVYDPVSKEGLLMAACLENSQPATDTERADIYDLIAKNLSVSRSIVQPSTLEAFFKAVDPKTLPVYVQLPPCSPPLPVGLCRPPSLSLPFSVFLSFSLSLFLSFSLSLFLSFSLSLFLSFCLSVFLSVYPSVFQFPSLSLSSVWFLAVRAHVHLQLHGRDG